MATDKSKTAETVPDVAPTRSDNLRKAYGAAIKRLREQYLTEFNALYVEEAANLGETYTPPLSAEQKAAKQMQSLLTDYPELREQFGQVQADGSTVTAG